MIPALALLTNDVTWPAVLLLGALAGLLALDDTAFAQTWFGQPLPAALIAGFCCGDPQTGLVIGLGAQLVVLANLPVGQTFVGDVTTAALAAVGAATAAGHSWRLAEVTGNLEAMALLGWLMAGIMLLSLVGNRVIKAERQAHVLWMMEGHRTLRDGSLGRIERLQLQCMLATFLRGFLLGIFYMLLLSRAWLPLVDHLPAGLQPVLALLPVLAPAVGIGALMEHWGIRVGLRWLAAGLGVALISGMVF